MTRKQPVQSIFQAALAHQQAGRLPQAEALYRQVLQSKPSHLDSLNLLGMIASQTGRLAEATALIERAIAARPYEPALHRNLGQILCDQHKFVAAASCYRKALSLKPDDWNTLYNLGNTLQMDGKLEEAITCYRQAVSVKPDFAEAQNNLGLALQRLGNMEEAEACYRRTCALMPNSTAAHYNLGHVLQSLGKLDEATGSYRRALALKPDDAEVHNSLGITLRKQGNLNGAIASYRRAISLKPDFTEAYNNLGRAYFDFFAYEDAITNYRKAISLKPDFAEAYGNLGQALRNLGKLDDALACFQRAQALRPCSGLEMLLALMLPPIMGTRAEVLQSRQRIERNLDSLLAGNITLDDPHDKYGTTNFLLAYHGMNDRDIQQKIARFHEQTCPALLYTAPHCNGQRPANSRLKVGFLSKYIYAHSVSACFNKIVAGLASREEFGISLISTHDHNEESARNTYPDFAGAHIRLPNHLARARETVAALELDVLVYLDIGMDPLSYFLAFSRLAPAQCVIGGHPVTTGIRNMDYFLSSALAEPEDADSHYSEKLVRLPIRPSYFRRPALPSSFKTRKELGLPESGHIYSCPMKLQKLHPDFDEAITRILQLDTSGHVILFEDRVCATWRKLLEERFVLTIPAEVRGRILFLPWISDSSSFISMNKLSDVILDPFHFGIGTTAISTFSVATPIVTRPGEFLRGRIGFQFCKLLDIPECVANDTEDYAQKAAAIASNPSLRAEIQARIVANDHLLFDNPQTIEDMANFLLTLRTTAGTTKISA